MPSFLEKPYDLLYATQQFPFWFAVHVISSFGLAHSAFTHCSTFRGCLYSLFPAAVLTFSVRELLSYSLPLHAQGRFQSRCLFLPFYGVLEFLIFLLPPLKQLSPLVAFLEGVVQLRLFYWRMRVDRAPNFAVVLPSLEWSLFEVVLLAAAACASRRFPAWPRYLAITAIVLVLFWLCVTLAPREIEADWIRASGIAFAVTQGIVNVLALRGRTSDADAWRENAREDEDIEEDMGHQLVEIEEAPEEHAPTRPDAGSDSDDSTEEEDQTQEDDSDRLSFTVYDPTEREEPEEEEEEADGPDARASGGAGDPYTSTFKIAIHQLHVDFRR
jgi:hypothetical protein